MMTSPLPNRTCRLCGTPQPTDHWRPPADVDMGSLLDAWQHAPPMDRYCGLCSTPACPEDLLDRLQQAGISQRTARLYGASLVSPTPEVVAFMAGWDVAAKGAAD